MGFVFWSLTNVFGTRRYVCPPLRWKLVFSDFLLKSNFPGDSWYFWGELGNVFGAFAGGVWFLRVEKCFLNAMVFVSGMFVITSCFLVNSEFSV